MMEIIRLDWGASRRQRDIRIYKRIEKRDRPF
jgi:hypothetical protein